MNIKIKRSDVINIRALIRASGTSLKELVRIEKSLKKQMDECSDD